MAFTVYYTRGEKPGYDDYDDSHEVAVKDFGVLEVTKDGEQVKLYSPNYWSFVEPSESDEKKSSSNRAWVL